MFRNMMLAAAAALTTVIASTASAATVRTIGLNPSGGGAPVFAKIASTNEVLALVNVIGSEGTLVDLEAVNAAVSSSPLPVSNIYTAIPGGGASWAGTPPAFLNVSDGITIESISTTTTGPDRMFDALWLAFSDNFPIGNLNVVLFNNPATMGTSTLALSLYNPKEALHVPAPVPVPAALPLLAGGLGMLALLRRRRATA
jgi:hypothetical protein